MSRPFMPIMDRFWIKVKKTETCWNWVGVKSTGGYGRLNIKGEMIQAHRISYEDKYGKILSKMEIDHLCRNRLCVNPDHLEAVTGKVNKLRGTSPAAICARKTVCVRGHLLSIDNLYEWGLKRGMRSCIKCSLIRSKEQRDRIKRKGEEPEVDGMEY